jgi:hypothetical protein
MTNSTRIRFGALVAAAAVVAGGFFATAPANAAATGTITVTPSTIKDGTTDWGTGFTVAGTDFTGGSTLDLELTAPDGSSLGTFPTTADANGGFSATVVPNATFPILTAGDKLTVSVANSSAGDTAADATITQLAAQSITANLSTITTDELAAGTPIEVYACGYLPGETITTTVDYAGQTFDVSDPSDIADEIGCIGVAVSLVSGTATAGDVVIHVNSASLPQSTTVTVTGADATVPGSTPSAPPAVNGGATTTASGSSPTRLPVVSG